MLSRNRINRNILECKVGIHRNAEIIEQSINRNILECKGVKSSNWLSSSHVLIETYWNVKEPERICIPEVAGSINRNILECKVRYYW